MAETTQPKSSGGNFRWTICALLFFSVAINYIDRNIIGILKMPLSKELGWGEQDYAHIVAAFSYAYGFGYLFAGRILDGIGVKRGLPVFILLWSLASAAHGLCTYIPIDRTFGINIPWFTGQIAVLMPMTAFGFLSARVMLGLAEGGSLPGAIKTVAEWYPAKERALATGLFNAGTNVGAILCPLSVPFLYKYWGWPLTFYVTGLLGLVWIAFWWWLYEMPEKHKRLSAAERAYIQSEQPPVTEKKKAPSWISLLGYRAVWAYLFASVLAGPVWTIYMFFLPDFLDKRYKIPLEKNGGYVALFYFLATFGSVAVGWLTGRLLNRGWSVNAARKSMLLLCALCVVPVFTAPYLDNIWLTIIILGIAGSAHQGWSANLFSFVSDTMPKNAVGAVVGFGGFVAYMMGGFVSEFIGYQLKTRGNYILVFGGASLMYVISITILHLLVPKIQQVDMSKK